MVGRRTRVLFVALLLVISALVAPLRAVADHLPDDAPSACHDATPADAPYGCLEAFPLGPSAWVTFDGNLLGLSPVGIPEIEPGTHTIRFDRDGFQPWTEAVTIGPGEVRRLDPPMAQMPGIYPGYNIGDAWPLAVMVENHPDARPQVGLQYPDIVYEALAEGGISRFMAVYLTQEADVIGPVRSTRHYFVYLAAEFNATLVHVGSSPIGYAALAATNIRRLNESAGDPGVWRSEYRYAPHNAFTGTVEARAAADSVQPSVPGTWGPMVYKDPSIPTEAPPATYVRIDYPPGGWYTVEYTWDPESNYYPRYMDGVAHEDGLTGEAYRARNIVIQVVPDEVIDREGRLDLAQTGVGDAYFFVDGTLQKGYWTKADFGSRTFYWDTAGNMIRLNPVGTTWVQLVPTNAVITIE